MPPSTTYLDLRAGPFRLALSAECVLGVVTDVATDAPVALRGEELPFCDLPALFGDSARSRASFAVCFEADCRSVAVGVDRVDHLHVATDTNLLAVPPFGLHHPELFTGILRDPTGLLLVLSPLRMSELTAPK